ncbi:MAG: bifunctional oligoribonuclease/PAP phosphatase NrnA [Nitrospiraceae bacterium]|nr:bifunctional oligoribonuclease/PAP phosphatase NrnA [Nitrospiraceae bacterium]
MNPLDTRARLEGSATVSGPAGGEEAGLTPPAGLLDFIRDGANRRFLVASHINPEGDALGSTLALAGALRALGKEALSYNRDGTPEPFRFLPGWEDIRNVLPGRPMDFTLVLVDCSTPSRAALEGVSFARTVVIDHHELDVLKPGGSAPADIMWVAPSSPAAGMMVYGLIKALGVEIDPAMATSLYTAVSTDTGSFRYSNATAEAFETAAALVRAGAEPDRISQDVYETWTEKKMRLLCLSLQNLELRDGAAIMSVESGMFRATGTDAGDTDNFTSFPRLLRDAQVAVVLSEVEGGLIRGSLRSKGRVDVRLVARKFGGGGHIKAAGFRISAGENGLPKLREDLFKAIAEASRKKE